MEDISFFRLIASLVAVLALVWGAGRLTLMWRRKNPFQKTPHNPRLSLVEQLYMDAQRRLVLVKWDGKEHLILLGAKDEQVIDSVTLSSVRSSQIRIQK